MTRERFRFKKILCQEVTLYANICEGVSDEGTYFSWAAYL